MPFIFVRCYIKLHSQNQEKGWGLISFRIQNILRGSISVGSFGSAAAPYDFPVASSTATGCGCTAAVTSAQDLASENIFFIKAACAHYMFKIVGIWRNQNPGSQVNTQFKPSKSLYSMVIPRKVPKTSVLTRFLIWSFLMPSGACRSGFALLDPLQVFLVVLHKPLKAHSSSLHRF